MRVKDNLSSVTSVLNKKAKTPPPKAQVGRVYGIVTTEGTPTPAMFERAGGYSGIGTIFYLDYAGAKNTSIDINDTFFIQCKMARPLNPQIQYYPVLGELVYLQDLPSPVTQISNTSFTKYYISPINLWSNNQQNSQPASVNDSLGLTFVENPFVKNLLAFEGDHIIQGRQGAGLRFSSTTKLFNNLNEWSSTGNEDSPITILTTGYDYNSTQNKVYVEQINKDASSIYLTTTQKLPLQTDKTGVINPLTNPINPQDYSNSQLILNSDRVTLNSKKDEVMIFAKTNVEINTNNIINLNANERVHLNTNAVFLGTVNNSLPTEPLLLGNRTYNLLTALLQGLYGFGTALSAVVGSPEGAPAIDINSAAEGLLDDLDRVSDALEGILSQQNFTA